MLNNVSIIKTISHKAIVMTENDKKSLVAETKSNKRNNLYLVVLAGMKPTQQKNS